MKFKENICGFILAGGKSSRMGTDKALLMFQDKPLLLHMIKLVEPFCSTITVSGINMGYEHFGVDLIPDLFPDCGPISGLYSSLCYSEKEWNFFVSVDVPFVNDELFVSLISNIGESDCIIPKHISRVEPLIGLYHRRTRFVIEEMIASGDYRLTNMISKLNSKYLNCNDLINKYPRLFMNINRMEDYQSI